MLWSRPKCRRCWDSEQRPADSRRPRTRRLGTAPALARARPQQLGRNDNRHIRVGVRDDPIACFWALPRAYNNSVSTFTPLLVSTIGIGRSTPGGWFFRL